MNSQKRCPRCDGGRLKGWDELNEEEREVVKRLPVAADSSLADSSLEERRKYSLWCPRCWHEESPGEQRA